VFFVSIGAGVCQQATLINIEVKLPCFDGAQVKGHVAAVVCGDLNLHHNILTLTVLFLVSRLQQILECKMQTRIFSITTPIMPTDAVSSLVVGVPPESITAGGTALTTVEVCGEALSAPVTALEVRRAIYVKGTSVASDGLCKCPMPIRKRAHDRKHD